MRFRPRYSLLTLLVLTALVAGGVKLWRGPHHVVIHGPQSKEENLLLEHSLLDYLNTVYPPVVYEYEYLNSWNDRDYLFVVGHTMGLEPIPVYRMRFSDKNRVYLIQASNLDLLAAENDPRTNENIVCWMYNPNSKKPAAAKGQSPAIWRNPAAHGCYFLTNRKKLYRGYDIYNFGVPLDRVELQEIADPEFRQCVAAELEKIPAAR